MADQRELQRKNQELIRKNRQLERELQKKEKTLTVYAAQPSRPEAVAERFREAVALKKARSTVASGRGALIEAENRSQLMTLLNEGIHAGASIKVVANLFGI